MQAGPIVRHKNRVAGIGGIVLHAGGLAGGDALEAQALFESRHVLRGFIRDARDRVAVTDQAAQTVSTGSVRRSFASRKHWWIARFLRGFKSLRFDKLDNQALNNAADLIELKTAAAFFVLRIIRFSEIVTQSHGRGGHHERPDSHNDPPIDS